jgi:hypothetical protein
VIAQTTMARYAGTEKTIGEIGTELRADFIVKGAIRRDGEGVHLTVQLIRVKDLTQVWRGSFDRNLQHVMTTQMDIARAVAQGIEQSLKPNPQVEMVLTRPLDPMAYEAYLHGDFSKAIELDPYYEPAYAAQGRKLYLAALFGFSHLARSCVWLNWLLRLWNLIRRSLTHTRS